MAWHISDMRPPCRLGAAGRRVDLDRVGAIGIQNLTAWQQQQAGVVGRLTGGARRVRAACRSAPSNSKNSVGGPDHPSFSGPTAHNTEPFGSRQAGASNARIK